MFNHIITRLAYWPIFFIMFVSGLCTGSIIGLTLALMDRTAIGLFGGAFIALLGGLISGFLGLIYTAVFNLLAPAMGGVALNIEELPVGSKNTIDQPSPDSSTH